MPALRLIQPASLLTLRGSASARKGAALRDLAITKNQDIWIRDGIIVGIGPRPETLAQEDVDEIDCRGRCVMPGLIDSHTHVVWGGNRRDELEQRLAGADYETIFAQGGGILSSVQQTRARSEEQLLHESVVRVQRMIASGTTALEIKSGYGLELETEMRQLRVAKAIAQNLDLSVATTCLAAHAIPPEARKNDASRAAYIETVCHEILPAVKAENLATFVDVFCDRGAFNVQETRKICQQAQQLGFAVRLHANELGHTGGAQLAVEMGAHSADHLLYLHDDDRRALANAGVITTLLPGTSMVLDKNFADGRALVEAGCAIAIASDCNPGSCAIESLSLVLALACYGCKLTPAEAICATTHNAAVSLGWQTRMGRIEQGLDANLLILASDDYRDLIYHAGSPLIEHVIIRGKIRT